MAFRFVDERDQVWEIRWPTYRVEVWDQGLLGDPTGHVTWLEFAAGETVDSVLAWARSEPGRDDLVIVHVVVPADGQRGSHVGIVEIWRNAQVSRPIERR